MSETGGIWRYFKGGILFRDRIRQMVQKVLGRKPAVETLAETPSG